MEAHPHRITLEVVRSDATRPSTFDVPVAGRASRVLDALLYVREHLDCTLRFRYACRNGMCGSCAIVVNGREALSCQAAIAALGTSTVHVAPLRGLPVLGDLVCDMAPFFDTLRRGDAALRPADPSRSTPRIMPPAEPHRATIERHNGCITCGACDSACASTRASLGRASLGPAALNRVFMLIGDERDASGPARLRGISDDVRALREGGLDAIDQVCPANIPLREAIVALDARGGMP